jgi:hypothetical protein
MKKLKAWMAEHKKFSVIALCLLSLIWGIYSEVKYMRNHSRKAAAAN